MAKSATPQRPELKKSIRPPKPTWPDGRPALAVSYSGGGYRASLAGMGVTRALADLGLLGDVRYTSSVSGGSWANALLALNWDELKAEGFTTDAVDRLLIEPFVTRITTSSLTAEMMKNLWKVLGPKTRSDLLGDTFDAWFGGGRTLGDLSPDARFIFNATNLNSGRRFFFEQARAGDYKAKYVKGETIRVADALAASAALPGALSAQRMRTPHDVYPKENRPYLVDGAVYDNLGLEAFGQIYERPLMVVLDAGAELRAGIMGKRSILRTVKRSSSVVQNQVTSLRKRWLIEGFRAWEDWEEHEPDAYRAYTGDQLAANAAIKEYVKRRRKKELRPDEVAPPMPPRNAKRGVTFGLDTSMDPKDGDIESTTSRHQRYQPDGMTTESPPWHADPDAAAFRTRCASVPMSAGKFDPVIAADLIYRGWWLTRESMRTFHPDALQAAPPAWNEWNPAMAERADAVRAERERRLGQLDLDG